MKLTDKATSAVRNAEQEGDAWVVTAHHSTRKALHREGVVKADGRTLTALGVELLESLAMREWDTASTLDNTAHSGNLRSTATENADTDARVEGFDRYSIRWYRSAVANLAVAIATTPEDLSGVYWPNEPGARSLADAESLTVDGAVVRVVVTGRTATLYAGETALGTHELPSDMARSDVNRWAQEMVASRTAAPETRPCVTCDRGLRVVEDGRHVGHLYPVGQKDRGYRMSSHCHGRRPEAVWDVYGEGALARAVRTLAETP